LRGKLVEICSFSPQDFLVFLTLFLIAQGIFFVVDDNWKILVDKDGG
jgi:hypothetical protein